ncbi:hypothetical protein EST38_g7560 [Candolleomyces aberdarensis]|uniref:SGNH hydrolase-type esterase domain-containing protein n=1 Tax=Candolleomyces aberdarensis TaxID=2316362 RepID=A0A4Q2DEX5_9AGAR|nr:hypothetical protein EST38_g7560 [Candolleomyces aberdarensis]
MRETERLYETRGFRDKVVPTNYVLTRTGYSQCQPGGVPTTSTQTSTHPNPTAPPTTIITTPTPTQTIPSGPVIVLPLGDSITYGMGSNDGNSYRKELKDLLSKDGITIDYIGTVKNGNIQDNDNEGHSGATIAQISGYADTPLRQKPQVVTLMAGTNDMIGQDVSNAPTRFMQLIDKIFTASPQATVFVASLIPLSFSQSNVDQYNSRIQSLIQQSISSGQKVVWVSMASVTNSDLADGVHPNAGGYVKMGQAWYNGWVSARQSGWVA